MSCCHGLSLRQDQGWECPAGSELTWVFQQSQHRQRQPMGLLWSPQSLCDTQGGGSNRQIAGRSCFNSIFSFQPNLAQCVSTRVDCPRSNWQDWCRAAEASPRGGHSPFCPQQDKQDRHITPGSCRAGQELLLPRISAEKQNLASFVF